MLEVYQFLGRKQLGRSPCIPYQALKMNIYLKVARKGDRIDRKGDRIDHDDS